jgi:hypothetical protein
MFAGRRWLKELFFLNEIILTLAAITNKEEDDK